MHEDVVAAIVQFFDSVEKLRLLGVIRSDKHLGDLGEYIATHFYEIELALSGRQPGYDGKDKEGLLVQVKYHGSCTRTNVDLGNPDHYQTALVILGPNSRLRPTGHAEDFLIYRFSAESVRSFKNEAKGTYSCGKQPFSRQPDQTLTLPRPQPVKTELFQRDG